jgi:hypothetical protein
MRYADHAAIENADKANRKGAKLDIADARHCANR